MTHTRVGHHLGDVVPLVKLHSQGVSIQVFETCHPGDSQYILVGRRVVKFHDKRVRFHVIIEFFQRPGKDQMPVFYHLDIVAHSLHFRQDMRGKQNGMINSNLLDQLANLKNLIRV